MNNLELSNIGGLDESICNAIGMNNNLEYSNLINEDLLNGLTENTSLLNADGGGNTITPEQAAQIGKAAIDIGKALAPKADGDGCKKPVLPESFLNRGKWSTYKDCLRNAQEAKQAATKAEQDRIDLERERLERERLLQQSQQSQRASDDDGGDKFLGMPKAVGITVTVVGGLALIVGGIFLVKKLRK
jgi:hypothetical protein